MAALIMVAVVASMLVVSGQPTQKHNYFTSGTNTQSCRNVVESLSIENAEQIQREREQTQEITDLKKQIQEERDGRHELQKHELQKQLNQLNISYQEERNGRQQLQQQFNQMNSSYREEKDKRQQFQEQLNQLNISYQEKRDDTQKLQDQLIQLNSSYEQLQEEFNLLKTSPGCIEVNTSSHQWLNSGHKTNLTFGDIMDKVQQGNMTDELYVLKSNYLNTAYAFHISIVNNQLWVPVYGNYTILVLDTDTFKRYKEIRLSCIEETIRPLAVLQANSHEVFLAAYNGLFVLDVSGSFLYKVGGGKIEHIAFDGDNLYAFNHTYNDIVTIINTGDNWVIIRSFRAVNYKSIGGDTIAVVNSIIYLCTLEGYVNTYTLTGTYIATNGINGNNSPGHLQLPSLCGVDSEHSLLICDFSNHRLQVLSPGGSWQVYELEGVTYLFDVVTDSSGNLWLLWQSLNPTRFRITKFYV